MDINAIFSELAQYTRLQEEAAAMVDALRDQIKEYMAAQGVDTLTGAEHRCSWKAVTSSRLDTAALKRAAPDIAAAYTVKTEARRFTFV